MPRSPLEYNAVITKRWDLVEGLAVFRVRPDADAFQGFIPGQYITLGLNHPEKGPVQRAYSIASPPHVLPDFDFYVRYVEQPTSDNPLTHLLFACGAGARIHIGKKIVGKFTVEHEVGADDPRLRVCVAAGTGLAPFLSMVKEHFHLHGPTDRFLVLHGARWPREIGYRAEMEDLLNQGPFPRRYFPTVSRDPGSEHWPREYGRGRVEAFFDEDRIGGLEGLAGLDPGSLRPDKAVVFICGLNGTIASTILRLLGRGFVPKELKLRRAFGIPDGTPASLFFEQYDSDPVIDLSDEALVRGCRERLASAGVALAEA